MASKTNYERYGNTALGFVLAGNLESAKEEIEFFFKRTGFSDKGKFDYFCWLHKQLYEAEEQAGKSENIEMHDYLATQVSSFKDAAKTSIEERYQQSLAAIEENVNKYGTYFNV